MKKTVLLFTLISILAKIIAFGRELVLSYFFGAGQISDVFLLSMTLPVTIFGFVAAGVTSGYIPVYQRAKTEENQSSALQFTNQVITFLILLCLTVILIYFLFPNQLLRLFANGFDKETLNMARQFTNFSIWATVFTAIVTVFTGYLQINGQIKITALVSVPLNVGVIITIVVAVLLKDAYILPIGFLLSSAVQVLFLWCACTSAGYKFSLSFQFNSRYMIVFLSSLAMLILSGSLQQVNVLIDRTLATTVTVGGLSIFEYGNKINDFVMGLTIIPISAALFPIMTNVKDDSEALERTITEGIRLSSIIIIPASIVLVVFSEVIVRILYFRGAFDANSVALTSDIVKFYGVGLIAFSLREMILKCFYAVGDVKSPMINSTIGVVCNIVLNFVLLHFMGLGGLALATSIAAGLCVILFYVSLKKHLKNIHIGSIIIRCGVLFVIAGVLCLGAFFIYLRLSAIMGSVLVPFIISMICFGVLYFIMIIMTGMIRRDELRMILRK